MEVLGIMYLALERLLDTFCNNRLTRLRKVRESGLVFWMFFKVEIEDFVKLEYIFPIERSACTQNTLIEIITSMLSDQCFLYKVRTNLVLVL